jgi:hypothetical protein
MGAARATADQSPHRTNCGRPPRDDENPLDEWRVYPDRLGELLTSPEMRAAEFEPDA